MKRTTKYVALDVHQATTVASVRSTIASLWVAKECVALRLLQRCVGWSRTHSPSAGFELRLAGLKFALFTSGVLQLYCHATRL
jgi:hypothetical protein